MFIGREKQPSFFVADRAHHSDVGGMSPGSMPLARELFQEGLIIPPIRPGRNDDIVPDVLALILANVRTPDEREGDIAAQIASNRVAEKRLREIVARYGARRVHGYASALQDYTERVIRATIREIPDGTYTFDDALEDDGFGTTPIRIQVSIRIDGETAVVDFTGSDPQTTGVNANLAITLSASLYAFRCLVGDDVLYNAGVRRPVDVIAPEGTIVNARRPAAVAGGNVETSQRITDVVLGALAKALPAVIPAASQGTMNNVTLGGVHLGALSDLAFNAVPAAMYLVLSVMVMWRLDRRLALLVVAFSPLPALIARLAAPTQTRRERTLLERWARIYSRFNEVLSGITTVKSFAMEDAEKKRFLDEVNSANEVVIRGIGVDSGVGAAQNVVQIAARVAALALGSVLVLRGEITVGTLVAFLGYVGGLFGPVLGLAGVYKTFRTARVSVEEVYAILDARDALADAPDAREVGRVRGEVAWKGVRFSYGGRAPWLLDGIDLSVRAGERLAVVGASGSGKSTLVSFVQRFHDPCEGVVTVDGVDVRRLEQRSLRRQVGAVLQEPLLFNESVLANIAYGRPEASVAEIEAAARAANAHAFVMRLPQGYHTVVGERGCRLSVGERQRIAIARTLLKDPAILVLDEPTSALDAESEHLVHEALERVARGRTTLVVAHRLSTVVNADRIVVLGDGRILEEGSHAELLARKGPYAALVEKQARGLLLPMAA